MLIIVPISRADRHLADTVVKSFALFPPGNDHDLLVVGSPNVSEDVRALHLTLSRHFKTSRVHIFDQDTHMGWPTACNTYFQETCYYLTAQGQKAGWFWFELDCTPVKSGWLNSIEVEYNSECMMVPEPKWFMGSRQKTYRGRNGELLSEEEAGEHMAAPGVYPWDVVDRVVTMGGLRDTHIPWWNFIQWSLLPSLKDTKLIQQNYRTINYRMEEGKIVSDSDNNWAWGIGYNDPISPEAVLVHGCKDGSLLKVLEPTRGTVMAAEIRQECNKLSKEEREELNDVAMALIEHKPVPKSYKKRTFNRKLANV